jgi:hypothetical protein
MPPRGEKSHSRYPRASVRCWSFWKTRHRDWRSGDWLSSNWYSPSGSVPPLWKMQKRTSLTRSLTLTILYSLLYLGYRQRKGMRNLIKWPYRVDKCRHSSTDPRLQLARYIRHVGVAHSLTASISARLLLSVLVLRRHHNSITHHNCLGFRASQLF